MPFDKTKDKEVIEQSDRCAGREYAHSLADAIEQHLIPDLGFNMGWWVSKHLRDESGYQCGTTACIAGWDHVMNTGDKNPIEAGIGDTSSLVKNARARLGLTEAEGNYLFAIGVSEFLGEHGRHPRDIDGVAVLRHYGNTGELDWSKRGKAIKK